jgi:hypothetical protein
MWVSLGQLASQLERKDRSAFADAQVHWETLWRDWLRQGACPVSDDDYPVIARPVASAFLRCVISQAGSQGSGFFDHRNQLQFARDIGNVIFFYAMACASGLFSGLDVLVHLLNETGPGARPIGDMVLRPILLRAFSTDNRRAASELYCPSIADSPYYNYQELIVRLLWGSGLFYHLRIAMETLSDFDGFGYALDLLEAAGHHFQAAYRQHFAADVATFAMGSSAKFVSANGLRALNIVLTISRGTAHEEGFASAQIALFAQCCSCPPRHELLVGELRRISMLPSYSDCFLAHLPQLFRDLIPAASQGGDVLAPAVSIVATMLDAKGLLDHKGLLGQIRPNSDLLAVLLDIVQDVIDEREVEEIFFAFPDVGKSKSLLLKLLLHFEIDFETAPVLRELLSLNDAEVNATLSVTICRKKELRDSFYITIVELNDEESKFDLWTVCRILREIGTTSFQLHSLAERVFFRFQSDHILPFFECFPFLTIDDLGMLFEFAPHTEHFFSFLEKFHLERIDSIAEELVALDDESQEYVSLLTSAFKQSQNLILLWRAASLLPVVGDGLLAMAQLAIDGDKGVVKRQLISALERDSRHFLLKFLLSLDLSQVSLAGYDVPVDGFTDETLAFMGKFGFELDQDTILTLAGSDFAFANEVAAIVAERNDLDVPIREAVGSEAEFEAVKELIEQGKPVDFPGFLAGIANPTREFIERI